MRLNIQLEEWNVLLFNLNECILSAMALYISCENDELLQLTETDLQLINIVITCTLAI